MIYGQDFAGYRESVADLSYEIKVDTHFIVTKWVGVHIFPSLNNLDSVFDLDMVLDPIKRTISIGKNGPGPRPDPRSSLGFWLFHIWTNLDLSLTHLFSDYGLVFGNRLQ
jgi:hypothetical protein